MFISPKKTDGDTGLLLMIHGGAFVMGDKSQYGDDLLIWSNRGYVAAAVNYHYLSDQFDIYDILDDITLALTKVKELCEERGVTVKNVLFTGTSAGAHLALLYPYARSEESPIAPAAVVSYCGSTMMWDETFLSGSQLTLDGGASGMADIAAKASGLPLTRETYEAAIPALKAISPITYVNENTVPTLICHGVKDTVVPPSQAKVPAEKLAACGVPYDLLWYPNSGHELDGDPDCTVKSNELFARYAQTYLCAHN